MTESSAVLTALGPDEHRARRRAPAIGRAAAARRRALASRTPTANRCRPGETGEVCARAGNFMREYWKQAGGDRGGVPRRLVPHRRRRLPRRARLPVPRRPREGHDRHRRRERVLGRGRERDREPSRRRAGRGDRHPATRCGARPCTRSSCCDRGATVTDAEIIDHARQWIAGYKVPKTVEFRTEPLPLSGALKVLKRDLRAPYWEGRGRGVN